MSEARAADACAQHEQTSEFSRRWLSKRLSHCVQRSDVKAEPDEIEDSPNVGASASGTIRIAGRSTAHDSRIQPHPRAKPREQHLAGRPL